METRTRYVSVILLYFGNILQDLIQIEIEIISSIAFPVCAILIR